MRKIRYKKGRKVQPSTLEYTGIYTDKPTEMQLFVYDESEATEFENCSVKDFISNKDLTKNNWLNLHGLSSTDVIQELSEHLELNTIVISDILNITKGTRLDEFDDTLFFSIKSILPKEENETILVEQISFLLQDHLIVSFQEKRGDFFPHIRERIRTNTGIVRKKKVDYLLYLLLDAVIENFYITIETKEEKIERLLLESKTSDNPNVVEEIEKMREVFHFLKRAIMPLRDALYTIKSINEDDQFNSIENSNYVFFGRLHQKTLELLEQIDYDMNSLDSASNFFYTAQSHRMNEVMKILTILSAIFMPITFIAGIYGMNFQHMPELEYQNGYFLALGLMLVIVVGMVFYFKRKRWF